MTRDANRGARKIVSGAQAYVGAAVNEKYAYAVWGRGPLATYLEPRVSGVVVPPWLRRRREISLVWPVVTDDDHWEALGMEVDDVGVRGWLIFGESEYWCDVPWVAVYQVRDVRFELGAYDRAEAARVMAYVESRQVPEHVPARRLTAQEQRDAHLADEARLRHDDALAALARAPRCAHGDRVWYSGPGSCLAPGGRLRWVVVACECEACRSGRWVALDQDCGGLPRHIARAAVTIEGDVAEALAGRWADRLTASSAASIAAESQPELAGIVAEHLYSLAMVSSGGEPHLPVQGPVRGRPSTR